MKHQCWTTSVTLCAALCFTMAGAFAFDESKFPDWKGKWDRVGPPRFSTFNPPLTPEYKALYDKDLEDQKAGGHGMETSWRCLPPGMPRIMNVYEPMEIVITPKTIHILISHIHDNRRIYTDGRDWPKEDGEPSYKGFSIGQWQDTDGDGRYDTLEVETRGPFKGPRQYETSGLPLHADNKTIVKERIYLDKNDRNTLYDEMTIIDNALTSPWKLTKKFVRVLEERPDWIEEVCPEGNPHLYIQGDNYFVGADGFLMPSKPGQAPPDLKYFKQPQR